MRLKATLTFLLLLFMFLVNPSNGSAKFESGELKEPNHHWTITFNKHVDVETVTNKTIYVVDAQGREIETTFSFPKPNAVVVNAPEKGYQHEGSYTLKITNQVKSTSGELLNEAVNMNFQIKSAPNVDIKGIGNLMNGGMYAEGEGFYLNGRADVETETQSLLVKVADGKEEILSKGSAYHLNIVDDWVFYNGFYTDGKGIYKTKLDGSETVQINSDDVCDLYVNEKYIVYEHCYNGLVSMDHDGNNRVTLFEIAKDGISYGVVDGIIEHNDWIYFVAKYDLYKVKADGSGQPIKVYDGEFGSGSISFNDLYLFNEDWVYLIVAGKREFIRMKEDGSEQQVFVDEGVIDSFNIRDSMIFYIQADDYDSETGSLWKMDLDGANKIKLADDFPRAHGLYLVHDLIILPAVFETTIFNINELQLEEPPLESFFDILNFKLDWDYNKADIVNVLGKPAFEFADNSVHFEQEGYLKITDKNYITLWFNFDDTSTPFRDMSVQFVDIQIKDELLTTLKEHFGEPSIIDETMNGEKDKEYIWKDRGKLLKLLVSKDRIKLVIENQ